MSELEKGTVGICSNMETIFIRSAKFGRSRAEMQPRKVERGKWRLIANQEKGQNPEIWLHEKRNFFAR